jgi:hypothetical protein
VRACLQGRGINVDRLKSEAGGVSLYVCLPARFLPTHARFLRLVVNLVLYRMEAMGREPPASGRSVLFVMDEFAALGRVYPVNGAARYKPRNKVVVEMAGCPPRLKEAEVVGRSVSYRPCRNSIVGPAGVATSYLPGPHDVHNLEDLLRFVGDRHYCSLPVKADSRGSIHPDTIEWQIAYVCGYNAEFPPIGRLHSDYPVLLLAPDAIGLIYPCLFKEDVSLAYEGGALMIGLYDDVKIAAKSSAGLFHSNELLHVANSLRDPLISIMRDPSFGSLPYIEGGF